MGLVEPGGTRILKKIRLLSETCEAERKEETKKGERQTRFRNRLLSETRFFANPLSDLFCICSTNISKFLETRNLAHFAVRILWGNKRSHKTKEVRKSLLNGKIFSIAPKEVPSDVPAGCVGPDPANVLSGCPPILRPVLPNRLVVAHLASKTLPTPVRLCLSS